MSAPTLESPPPKPPPRCYAHRSYYRYVRRVKGRSYQARVPLAGGRKWESVNLGLFSADDHGSMAGAERAAGLAAKAYYQRHRPWLTPWQVIQELQRDGLVPASVLPRWVYRLPCGRFAARCKRRRRGVVIDLPGPFFTPEAAHAAMRWWLLHSDTYSNPYLPALAA